jgi:hypothetical protein
MNRRDPCGRVAGSGLRLIDIRRRVFERADWESVRACLVVNEGPKVSRIIQNSSCTWQQAGIVPRKSLETGGVRVPAAGWAHPLIRAPISPKNRLTEQYRPLNYT